MEAHNDQITRGLNEASAWQSPSTRSGHNFNNVTITGTAVLGDVYGANGDMLLESRAAQQREAIIKALAYNGMNDKRRIIESADPRSLEWIRKSDYVKWLRSDDRLFWFDGKPGSGKSTLMKHLTTTSLTRDSLPKDGLKWYITWFFFDFRSGDNLANTPEGMLRAILLQWVNRDPSVAKVLNEGDIHILIEDLTAPVLLDQFALASQHALSQLCIFIDGLDECQTSLNVLMDIIFRLKEYTSFKICLASRPYPTIKEALCSFPRICLQDHNPETIRSYLHNVAKRLEDSLVCTCPPVLIDYLVEKADGVILWARFAFEQVLEGCRIDENVSILTNRCNQMPAEINDMFENSLQRIPKDFCFEAATYLLLIDSSKTPLSTAELLTLGHTLEVEFPNKTRIPQKIGVDQFERRLLVLLGSLINVTSSDVKNHIRSLTKRRGLATTCLRALKGCSNSELNIITSVHETFHTHLQTSTWYWNHLEPVTHGMQALSLAGFILSTHAQSVLQLSNHSVVQSLEEISRKPPYRIITDPDFRIQLLKDCIEKSLFAVLIPLRLLALIKQTEICDSLQRTIRLALRSDAMLPILSCLTFNVNQSMITAIVSTMSISNDLDIFWAFLGPAEGYVNMELSIMHRSLATSAGGIMRDFLWHQWKSRPKKSLNRMIIQYFKRGCSLGERHYWDWIREALFSVHERVYKLESECSPDLFHGPQIRPPSQNSSLADTSDGCVYYRLALEEYDRSGQDVHLSGQWMMTIIHLLNKCFSSGWTRLARVNEAVLGFRLVRVIVAIQFREDPHFKMLYDLSTDASADIAAIHEQVEVLQYSDQ